MGYLVAGEWFDFFVWFCILYVRKLAACFEHLCLETNEFMLEAHSFGFNGCELGAVLLVVSPREAKCLLQLNDG